MMYFNDSHIENGMLFPRWGENRRPSEDEDDYDDCEEEDIDEKEAE